MFCLFLFSTLFNCQLAVSSWVFLELQQVYRPYCYFVSALTFLWGLPCIAFKVFGWYSKEGSKKWAGKTMQQILHIVWRHIGSWGDLRCVLDGSSVEKSPPITPKQSWDGGLLGLLYVSGKLPTDPSPKPTFCPEWEVIRILYRYRENGCKSEIWCNYFQSDSNDFVWFQTVFHR